jgi:Anti-sigma factor NepR
MKPRSVTEGISMSKPEDEDPHVVTEVFDNDPVLDQRVQDAIGRSLKAHYDDLINAPIPDRFLVLLAQLEAREGKALPNGEADER